MSAFYYCEPGLKHRIHNAPHSCCMHGPWAPNAYKAPWLGIGTMCHKAHKGPCPCLESNTPTFSRQQHILQSTLPHISPWAHKSLPCSKLFSSSQRSETIKRPPATTRHRLRLHVRHSGFIRSSSEGKTYIAVRGRPHTRMLSP